MEINRTLRLSLLFEIYGPLLTQKQAFAVKDFLDNDLSLSEIAERTGSTRQSVNDLVKRSLKVLEDYESKLCVLDKFLSVKTAVKEIFETLPDEFGAKGRISRQLNKILEVF